LKASKTFGEIFILGLMNPKLKKIPAAIKKGKKIFIT